MVVAQQSPAGPFEVAVGSSALLVCQERQEQSQIVLIGLVSHEPLRVHEQLAVLMDLSSSVRSVLSTDTQVEADAGHG